ncbi:nuclear transport factor 2 family protein [Herbiconiux daphne]|uniref:nuclear transport factor 2 family protein n=1 Tax=Herbiconiux daphne TaxID=2970914 RepID=UPI0038B2E25B
MNGDALSDRFSSYDPSLLPAPVLSYLDAHDARRYSDAAAQFAEDASVVDDGQSYTGRVAIRRWLEASSTEFTYTSSRLSQEVIDATHSVVRIRVEGNFPGGVVTLEYQFEVDGRQIRQLAIEP